MGGMIRQLSSASTTHATRQAVASPDGTLTYAELESRSGGIAASLLGEQPDLATARVALLLPPGPDFVAALCGIWRAGGIAVPLCPVHPPPEMARVLQDSGAGLLVGDVRTEAVLRPLSAELDIPLRLVDEFAAADALPGPRRRPGGRR